MVLLSSCETMHGVDSHHKKFDPSTNKACIEKALRSLPEVQLKKHFTRVSDSKSFYGEPITQKVYYYIYNVPSLISEDLVSRVKRRPHFSIKIFEERSKNPKYYSDSYNNSFGHMNGLGYAEEDLESAEAMISKVDLAVKRVCDLNSDFVPMIRAY